MRKKTWKFSKKVFEGIAARVFASILIVLIFAHLLTMYSQQGSGELKVFIDKETGVHYVGSAVLGPTLVRLDADGNLVVEKEY